MDKYVHAIINTDTGQVSYINNWNREITALNAEQLQALKARTCFSKEAFEKCPEDASYYYIDDTFGVRNTNEVANVRYLSANYFGDKTLAEQVNLQQLFFRGLLRYAYLNDLADDHIWDGYASHYFISCENLNKADPLSCFTVGRTCNHRLPGIVYFKSEKDASKAVDRFAEPFLKMHPDFKECF